jgi:hypothetical protein
VRAAAVAVLRGGDRAAQEQRPARTGTSGRVPSRSRRAAWSLAVSTPAWRCPPDISVWMTMRALAPMVTGSPLALAARMLRSAARTASPWSSSLRSSPAAVLGAGAQHACLQPVVAVQLAEGSSQAAQEPGQVADQGLVPAVLIIAPRSIDGSGECRDVRRETGRLGGGASGEGRGQRCDIDRWSRARHAADGRAEQGCASQADERPASQWIITFPNIACASGQHSSRSGRRQCRAGITRRDRKRRAATRKDQKAQPGVCLPGGKGVRVTAGTGMPGYRAHPIHRDSAIAAYSSRASARRR